MHRWILALVAAGALSHAPEAAADDVSTIVGKWNVISTQTHGCCGITMAGTIKSEVWEISVSGETVTAEVVPARKKDKPTYPVFTGTWDASTNTLMVSGGRDEPEDKIDPFLWWHLTLDGDQLKGTRRYLGVARNSARPESLAGGYKPCFEDSDVEATRAED